MSVPAVIYAAKSTEDVHGSIPTQVEDCRELAERNGWDVVGEYTDEAFSAYHGNRGPDLERAKRAAVDAAREHGRAVLVAQDADRFARGAGDAPGAADHLGEVYFAMKRQGVELWTVRSGQLDLLRAALEGERATDESARKSQATRAGLDRRRAGGKPVGALPAIGYEVEAWIDEHGRPQSRRVVSSKTGPLARAVFERLADGQTPGQVARWLNGQGVKTRRGARWSQSTVRRLVDVPAFVGGANYPAIITPELLERARDGLTRVDPAELQRRKGGRRPKTPYLLRGVSFCAGCGEPLYQVAARGRTARHYKCRNRLEATGMCDRPPIPADVLETHVLNHLRTFVGSVEGWIGERVAERRAESERRRLRLEADRAELAAIDERRARRVAEFAEHGVTHPAAFEVLDVIDRERGAQEQRIAEAEALLGEWEGATDVDEMLDAILAFYDRLAEAITDRIDDSPEVEAVNEALRTVLAGLWVEHERDRRRLLVRFALRGELGVRHDVRWRERNGEHYLERFAVPGERAEPGEDLQWLPPASTDYLPFDGLDEIEELIQIREETGAETTVSVCVP